MRFEMPGLRSFSEAFQHADRAFGAIVFFGRLFVSFTMSPHQKGLGAGPLHLAVRYYAQFLLGAWDIVRIGSRTFLVARYHCGVGNLVKTEIERTPYMGSVPLADIALAVARGFQAV